MTEIKQTCNIYFDSLIWRSFADTGVLKNLNFIGIDSKTSGKVLIWHVVEITLFSCSLSGRKYWWEFTVRMKTKVSKKYALTLIKKKYMTVCGSFFICHNICTYPM